MATLIDAAAVENFATAAAWRRGEKLYRDGSVSGTRPDAGGAAGTVTVRGKEYEPWVGVVNRRLIGRCSCAARTKLCAHAVALALDAVRLSLPWVDAERGRPKTDPAAAYKELSSEERGRVLDALLAEQPQLRKDAYRLARALLAPPAHTEGAAVELEGLRANTAENVAKTLRSLNVDDMNGGYRHGYGYVDEYQAACELIEPVVKPFEQDALRRLKLGLTDAAVAVAQGVLDGLSACEGSYDGDEVLCYAGEDLAHNYGHTLITEFEKAGIQLEWREVY